MAEDAKLDNIDNRLAELEAGLKRLETGLELLAMYYGLDLLVRPAADSNSNKRKAGKG